MQLIRLFRLYFLSVLQHRARMLVWFLISLLNPLLLILFWGGTGKLNSGLVSYYLLLIIAGALLMSHIEEDISEFDIKNGDLVTYLLKPYPYYWLKFYSEATYRITEGAYGIIAFLVLIPFFVSSIDLTTNFLQLILAVIIAGLAFLLSFSYKMVLGMISFWTTDIGGLFQVSDIVIITLAGYILPIAMMPQPISTIATIFPFSYMIYYPIAAFSNQLTLITELKVILIQIVWIIIFNFIYRKMWNMGIKKFSAVGQ